MINEITIEGIVTREAQSTKIQEWHCKYAEPSLCNHKRRWASVSTPAPIFSITSEFSRYAAGSPEWNSAMWPGRSRAVATMRGSSASMTAVVV